jgi:hypothetical protein
MVAYTLGASLLAVCTILIPFYLVFHRESKRCLGQIIGKEFFPATLPILNLTVSDYPPLAFPEEFWLTIKTEFGTRRVLVEKDFYMKVHEEDIVSVDCKFGRVLNWLTIIKIYREPEPRFA